MPGNTRNDGGKQQVGLFEMLDNVGHPESEPRDAVPGACATCRYWHPNAPRMTPLGPEPNPWHHCARLYVVTKRAYGSPIEAGTVLTPDEARAFLITAVDYLNTGPAFSCDQWYARDADPMDLWRAEEGA